MARPVTVNGTPGSPAARNIARGRRPPLVKRSHLDVRGRLSVLRRVNPGVQDFGFIPARRHEQDACRKALADDIASRGRTALRHSDLVFGECGLAGVRRDYIRLSWRTDQSHAITRAAHGSADGSARAVRDSTAADTSASSISSMSR